MTRHRDLPPDPARRHREANVRRAEYGDQQAGSWCQNCANWLPAPRGHIGLCGAVRASTRPAELCDLFCRRGSGEINST